MHLLPTSLAPLASHCDKNAVRGTHGVSLTVAADNTFTAMVTDGRQAMHVTGPCEGDASEYPTSAALSSSPNGETSSIIPAKEWKKAMDTAAKMTARTVKPLLRSCPVVIGKNVTSFGATDLESTAFSQPRNIEGRFPQIVQILPIAANAYATVEVDPFQLAAVLETIGKLGTTNELKRVTIELHQPKGHRGKDCTAPLAIRSTGATPLTCTAIVMPLTLPKAKGKKDAAIDETPAAMTDDDKRIHGLEMLVEEMRRQRDAAQEQAAYHRNNVEELRAELATLREEALTADKTIPAEQLESIAAKHHDEMQDIKDTARELVNERTEERNQAYKEMDRQRIALEDIAEKVRPLAKQWGTIAHQVYEIAKEF